MGYGVVSVTKLNALKISSGNIFLFVSKSVLKCQIEISSVRNPDSKSGLNLFLAFCCFSLQETL